MCTHWKRACQQKHVNMLCAHRLIGPRKSSIYAYNTTCIEGHRAYIHTHAHVHAHTHIHTGTQDI